MELGRLIGALTGRRQPSTVQLFRAAARFRDEGRFEEAAELVERGLRRDPASAVGHLMAAWLHAIFRRMDAAKAEFERVLALDATHPRALLGLARIALEANDEAAAAEHLRRAIARYPDFPEAQALLEVIEARRLPAPAAAQRATPPLTAPRLRVPMESREVILARTDGTLLFVQPAGARDEALAVHAAQLSRLAAAILARARGGAFTGAVVEGGDDVSYFRADAGLIVSLTFRRDTHAARAAEHLDHVWSAANALLAHGEAR